MTDAPSGARLNIFADLQIVADGQSASLVGDGQVLTFTAEAPQQLWANLQQLPVPAGIRSVRGVRALGQVAELLGDQGLELHVVGPAGELAHLGRGARSWWGRALTGSSRISVGSAAALRPVVLASVRRSRLFWPVLAALASGVAVAAARSGSVRTRNSGTEE
jgi:hypothetical protein